MKTLLATSCLLWLAVVARADEPARRGEIELRTPKSLVPGGYAITAAELKSRMRFQQTNIDKFGTPKSYKASVGYWKKVGHRENNLDEVIERLLTGGFNWYDVATAQLTQAYIGGDPKKLDHVLKALTQGRYGKLDNIRADDRSTFFYGEKRLTLTAKNAYMFRMVSADGEFLLKDPLNGKTHVAGYPPMKDFEVVHKDRIHHADWMPITGEFVWAHYIGPLQVAYAKDGEKMKYDSTEVQLGVRGLDALEAMQSSTGGLYHAVEGCYGKSKYAISNENNSSAAAGLHMQIEALKIVLTQKDLPEKTRQDVDKSRARAEKLLEGIRAYFKKFGYNKEAGVMNTGGEWRYDRDPAEFVPDKLERLFAVDCQTWFGIIFGYEIDEWYGKGAELKMWEETKKRSGYHDEKGVLRGVGFSNTKDVHSGEWTEGAIQWVLGIARRQEKLGNLDKAKQLVVEAQTMREGREDRLKVVDGEVVAFLYANKRYQIPFGWWANQLPSLASTTWAMMTDTGFNPFKLGGGPHFKRPSE